jgi:hypothetical protein
VTIKENVQSVHLERQHRLLHVWAVTATHAGEFHMSNESSQIHSASFLQVLDVTDFLSINHRMYMSQEIKI